MGQLKHNYAILQHQQPQHIEYAEDIDFIVREDIDRNRLIKVVKRNFAEFGRQLKDTKTEITHFGQRKDLTKVKKLG